MSSDTKPPYSELEWKRGLLHQVKFLGPDKCVHCGKKLTTDYFEELCEPRVKAKLASMAATPDATSEPDSEHTKELAVNSASR